MTKPIDSGQSEPDRAHGSNVQKRRKPYKAPELVEYGAASKLTQGALTMMSEGVGFSMNCL